MSSLSHLLLSVVCILPLSCHAGKPPNIIFVVADDLGWNDVGWRNKDIITPNLDRYAHSGVILNNSYVQPVCTPSRTSFMTGYFPYHTGMQHRVIAPAEPKYVPGRFTFLPQLLKKMGYKTHAIGKLHMVIWPAQPKYVPGRFTFLPELLKKVGYKTHAVGKWHMGYCNWTYTPTYRGFDSFFGFYNGNEDYYTRMRADKPYGYGFDFRFNTSVWHNDDNLYSADVYAARAADIIMNHDQRQPLYLYLPFQSVHSPLQVPERFEKLYKHIHYKDRRVYCGMVSALDEAFGYVTEALEASKIADNMLLVFTTDNGGPSYLGANNWPLRGAKTTTWEGGTRGSAFVYSKNLLNKTGYVNNEMIHAVDWFPTILELAGIKPEPSIDGVSQVQTIVNGAPSKRKEFVYNIDETVNRSAIRYGDYKLIQGGAGAYNGWYPPPMIDAANNGWYPSTKLYATYPEGFIDDVDKKGPEYMLFNVKDDPTEHFDLSKKEPEILEELKQRLSEWMKSLVPAFEPPRTFKANPDNYNGSWSPGWC